MSLNTDTVYNYSTACKKCGDLVDPVKRVFTTNKEVCPDCKLEEFSTRLKKGLG
jgi:RNA polymerase subunit RPABC4/transcription elongation factor Spt4